MILVDGNMLARRCYAKMDFLSNSEGVKTGLEYGFLRSVESMISRLSQFAKIDETKQRVIVCWDSKESIKKQIDSTYKADRARKSNLQDADSFYKRLNQLKSFVTRAYSSCEILGFEADDILGALAHIEGESQYNQQQNRERTSGVILGDEIEQDTIFIVTNDKDLLQVVSDKLKIVLVTTYNSDMYVWDEAEIMSEYGVSASKIVWYRAVIGDRSDSINGCERIRKKIVAQCVNKADSVAEAALNLLRCKDFHSREADNLSKFMAEKFAKNIAMMKLLSIPYVMDHVQHINDDDFLRTMLMRWEITNIGLSRKLGVVLSEETVRRREQYKAQLSRGPKREGDGFVGEKDEF